MKLALLVVFAVVFLAGCEAVSKKEAGKKGLQIGIKKKVENCKRTSKKGDKLSM